MDNGPIQNGKVLEEMLAGSSLDIVKITLRGLRNFQNDPIPFANSVKTSCHYSVTLSHRVESITNSSVSVTYKLLCCQFKVPGRLGTEGPGDLRFKLKIMQ